MRDGDRVEALAFIGNEAAADFHHQAFGFTEDGLHAVLRRT
jgi:hypothetical protein